MKTIIPYIIIFLLFGCSRAVKPSAVWLGKQSVPVNHPAPQGFKVTPYQAEQQVRDARRLSPKHIWHIYSDGSDYHIIDSFLSSNAKRARGGVIVDGQTGLIKK